MVAAGTGKGRTLRAIRVQKSTVRIANTVPPPQKGDQGNGWQRRGR